MKASRISDEYENGVEQFLQFTQQNAESRGGKFFCPCVNCVNGRRQSVNEIRSHLICDGNISSYTKWIWHGELADMPTVSGTERVDEDIREKLLCLFLNVVLNVKRNYAYLPKCNHLVL